MFPVPGSRRSRTGSNVSGQNFHSNICGLHHHGVARPRSIAGGTPSPDKIVALHGKGREPEEIAEKLGFSKRHVLEVLRVEEKGIAKLRRLIRKPTNKGGIIPRAGARLAAHDKDVQERLVGLLAGLDFNAANRVIQAEERRLKLVVRGRAPTRVDLDANTRSRCDELWRHIALRLHDGTHPVDPRVLAHAEILLVVAGRLEVEEVYGAKGTMARLISASLACKLLDSR